MTRTPLPNRRWNATRQIVHGAHVFTVTVGFGRDGRPREVFADGIRTGADLGHVLSDACIWASLLLQHGVRPIELLRTLGRVPDPRAGEGASAPASVLGAIAAVLVEEDPDAGEADSGIGPAPSASGPDTARALVVDARRLHVAAERWVFR